MRTVLIVEDDYASRLALELSLKNHYNVISLADLSEIERLFEHQHVDIVMMDIHLRESEVDGVQIMHQLKAKFPHVNTAYIAVTGYAMPGDEDRFRQQGFDGYLSKPVDFPALPAFLAQF